MLEQRYTLAHTEATHRGTDDHLKNFERAVEKSFAVIARSVNELQRLATSDNEIYATYYQLIRAEVRSMSNDKWSRLRAIADEALFPNNKEHIRFAALSLNNFGLTNYGACSIVLRTELIAHRASLFEENSIIFMKRHEIPLSRAFTLPRGYRATWEDRGKLCVAKLYKKIGPHTPVTKYADVLLREGKTTTSDNFVEVHIWGPMTARTIEQVTINEGSKRARRVIVKALKEKFDKAKIPVKVM
jgi:hypothetical protein